MSMTKQEFIIDAVLRMISNGATSPIITVEYAHEFADLLFPEKKVVYDDPISVLLDEIERLEEDEQERLEKEFMHAPNRSGYKVRISNVFGCNGIKNLNDLLKMGRPCFAEIPKVGKNTVKAVDTALYNLYGITTW